ncbi:hypothetical protein TNCV_4280331 [Trichonephila clavipes]|nr:hypothetical protein TNCV_4280331 [Trichonephila clavipes]
MVIISFHIFCLGIILPLWRTAWKKSKGSFSFNRHQSLSEGRGSLVVKVTDSWPEYHEIETSTTEDPPCRGVRCIFKYIEAQMSSRWCGGEVRRRGYQLRCRPRHLIMVQNYEVCHQKPLCS